MTQINLRLKEIRRQRDLSQEELARQLGISRQAVIALEQGVSLPSLPVIVAMLRVLDIPFSELFPNDWTPFRIFSPSQDGQTDYTLAALRHGDEAYTIPVTLIEQNGDLMITAKLAGVKEEDVTVDLSAQHVLIMAMRKPKVSNGSMTHINEIQYGPLMRILSLPYPVNTERATAEFDRGMLYLHLPRLLPETKRRITFKNESSEDKLTN